MRYRELDADGDYTFGKGAANFFIDSPATVRQSIETRLRLLQGEWYLNTEEGTPWLQEVLDKGHSQTYDLVIQTRILRTPGVRGIVQYQSSLDTVKRKLSIAALIDTIYSDELVPLEVTL